MMVVVLYEAAGKGKYRVTFDNGVTCLLYRKEAARLSIAEGTVITEEEYHELIYDIVGKRAKKRALHLLEQMDRTTQQLREKLQANEYPFECIEEAIKYVESFHYLDDARYAENYVRFSQEKMSKMQLRRKLGQKGIERNLIEKALEEYQSDELVQIEQLVRKRKYVPGNSDEKEFQRTYQYILRRGFKSSDILKVMKKECEIWD